MTSRRLIAAAAVLLALGAGLGTYFSLRGPSFPAIPRAQQSQILEQAKAEGVIDGYRVRSASRWYPRVYATGGGAVLFHSYGRGCGGEGGRPACLAGAPLIVLEYRHGSGDLAQAIQKVVHEVLPGAKIKTFEFTTLGG